MKKIIITSLLLVSGMVFSQMIVGGTNGTALSNKKAAVLLEFEAGQNKGIILPYVRTMPQVSDLTAGTLLLDATTASGAKVKYYAPGNAAADQNGWIDLSSGNRADITSVLTKQPATAESAATGAVIGAATSPARGVLVLESTAKAMVLPQVTSTDEIINPAPGMMVYVNKENAKRLAVFNGSKWTFWAP